MIHSITMDLITSSRFIGEGRKKEELQEEGDEEQSQASAEAARFVQAKSRVAAPLVYVVHVFLVGWVPAKAQVADNPSPIRFDLPSSRCCKVPSGSHGTRKTSRTQSSAWSTN